jgi:putative MATE family efflux protein
MENSHRKTTPNPEPSVRRQVLTLAWPAVLEQLLNMSVGLADTYIVGHLGAAPLAAVGLSVQTLNLFWSLFSAIGVGSTALVARRIGAKESAAAGDVARQSVLLALAIGVLVALVLWTGAPFFLGWLGAAPDVIELGTAYMRAVSSTVYLLSVLFIGSAIMRGAGDTRTPMLVMLAINAVNIVVAYTLAYGVGPLPRLGVLGSGIGAASARGLGGLAILALLMRGKGPVKIGHKVPRPDLKTLGQILRVGLPAAGEQLLMRAGQVLLATFITGLGTVAYAAHQVAVNALSVAYMPGWGFALAATTLVGQELGANRPERSSQSAYEALRMAVVVMALMGALVSILSAQIMGLFTDDPAVIAVGVPILRIAGFVMPFLGISFTLAGSLRGAGDTTSVLIIYGSSIWLVRVANAFWLSQRLGLIGIWIAVGVDFAVRAALLALRFRSGKWQMVEV